MKKVLDLKVNEKFTLHVHTSGKLYYWRVEPRNIQYRGTLSLLFSVLDSFVSNHDVEIINGTPVFTNRVESLILKKEDNKK